jgi:hypothetical protein
MHLCDQSHVLSGAQLPLPFQKKKSPFPYILRSQCPSTFATYEPTIETAFENAPFSPFPFFIREHRVLEEAVFFTTPRPNVVEFAGYLKSSWENRGAQYVYINRERERARARASESEREKEKERKRERERARANERARESE